MDSIPDGQQVGMPLVEVGALADDAVILDVRDAGDWQAGHAPGAVNIPLAQLISRLTELPVPPTGPLAVSCGGGTKQTRAVAYLRANGIEAVVLKGGMRSWKAAGRPMESADGDERG